jgi:hypothetical protein
MGYSKYKILSYKPTQKWHISCVVVGKGLYLGTLGSFDQVLLLETIFKKVTWNQYFHFTLLVAILKYP